jgi:hypothetical protein
MTSESRERARKMGRQHKYEVLVSATTRDAAIEIAAEAIPPHRPIVRTDAWLEPGESPDTWRVLVVFEGGGDEGEGPG